MCDSVVVELSFPLTLTLSLREREPPAHGRAIVYEASLSPRERAGVG